MKRLFMHIYYASALGTILQRLKHRKVQSAKYQIRKIKKGLRSGDQNRGMFFNSDYSSKAWAAKIGYEYFYCYPDRNEEIIRYFRKRGFIVEKSNFGKNLFIYKNDVH